MPKTTTIWAMGGLSLMIIIAITVKSYWPANEAIAQQAGQQQQAMPVKVQKISRQDITIWHDFSARLEAVEFAEIRPQISGRITDIQFKDGRMVNEGDVLYVIDPRPFEASLSQAKAALSAAKTESTLAQKELKRARDLIKKKVVSQRILDEREARAITAKSSIESAQAAVDSAQINRDYAYIKAPFSGRVGRAEIKLGNLVEANMNAPVLTTLIATNKIYADFEMDEQTYLNFVPYINQTDIQIPAKIVLNGQQNMTFEGTVDSFDNRINTSNGTIRVRAIFDNDKGLLVPGMFARLSVGTPSSQSTITVDETAIGTDQDRKFVYVANAENMVEYREVQIGGTQNGQRIIINGLKEGETVITSALMKLRPNTPITPQIAGSEETANGKNMQENAAE